MFGYDILTVRHVVEDANGDPLPADPDQDFDLDGCYAQPQAAASPSSTEAEDHRTMVVTLYKVFVPGDPDIRATSQLRVNKAGPWYEVIGEPNRWRLPDGSASHLEVQMRLVTG